MARVDLKHNSIQAKLVYYGPGMCGKTTNLQYVNSSIASDQQLMSLATEGDRTIFFDFFPLDLGQLRGMDVKFKLYTVPGQVRYNQTRKMVLKNVDGIVFVADSQDTMLDANLESFDNLFSNLKELAIPAESLAILVQYNKRDLPNVMPVDELDQALNPNKKYTTFVASAYTGEGVLETLKAACKEVLGRLMSQFDVEAGVSSIGTGSKAASSRSGKRPGVLPSSGVVAQQQRAAAKALRERARPQAMAAAVGGPAPGVAKASGAQGNELRAVGVGASAPSATAGDKVINGFAGEVKGAHADAAAIKASSKAGDAPSEEEARQLAAEWQQTQSTLTSFIEESAASARAAKTVSGTILRRLDDVQEVVQGLRDAAGKAEVSTELGKKLDSLSGALSTLVEQTAAIQKALKEQAEAAKQASGGPVKSLDASLEALSSSVAKKSDLDSLRAAFERRSPASSNQASAPALDALTKTLAEKKDLALLRKELGGLTGLATKAEVALLKQSIDKLIQTRATPKDELTAQSVAQAMTKTLAKNEDLAALRKVAASLGELPSRADMVRLGKAIAELPTKEDLAQLKKALAMVAGRMAEASPSVDVAGLRDEIGQAVAAALQRTEPAEPRAEVSRAATEPARDKDAAEAALPPAEPVKRAEPEKRFQGIAEAPAGAASEPQAAQAQLTQPNPEQRAGPEETTPSADAPLAATETEPEQGAEVEPRPAEASADAGGAEQKAEPRPAETSSDGAGAEQGAEVEPPPAETSADAAREQTGDGSVEPAPADASAEQADARETGDAEREAAGEKGDEPAQTQQTEAREAKAPESVPAGEAQKKEPESTADEAGEPGSEPEADVAAAAEGETKDDFADDPKHKNAARVARVMVADLYLYHRKEVEEGILADDFHERNKEALADMRATYESRIGPEIIAQKDYLSVAISDFIEKKRKQLKAK